MKLVKHVMKNKAARLVVPIVLLASAGVGLAACGSSAASGGNGGGHSTTTTAGGSGGAAY